MGAFSQLSIDIRDREKARRVEWAVMLLDETRPAVVWRVLGETRGHYMLEHGRIPGVRVAVPVSDCWIVA